MLRSLTAYARTTCMSARGGAALGGGAGVRTRYFPERSHATLVVGSSNGASTAALVTLRKSQICTGAAGVAAVARAGTCMQGRGQGAPARPRRMRAQPSTHFH
jgi:hypothetical protein